MMYELISSFTQQLEDAQQLFFQNKLAQPDREIHNIVVVGLGGSGIGGNLVQSLIKDHIELPYQVSKTYNLPNYVGKNTLFIASSFSGNTEETLTSLEEAKKRGAYIACLTSGGILKDTAIQNNFDLVNLKSLAECPRAHLPFSAISLLLLLHHYGFVKKSYVKELQSTIDNLNTKSEEIKSKAKELASGLTGRFPILYADARLEPMLIRFQQQINENAKQLCHVAVFPEMNHNELVGWRLLKDSLSKTHIFLFHSDYDHQRVNKRIEICEEIFGQYTNAITHVHAKGNSFIEQVFYLIYLTDWVSYFLAENNEVDPFPVDVITHLKTQLSC